MVRQIVRGASTALAIGAAIGGGGALGGLEGAAAVGVGCFLFPLSARWVLREDSEKSDLKPLKRGDGRLHATMAGTALAGLGAIVESVYWVKAQTATAVTGWSHQISASGPVKFIPAKIGNAVVNALGFENCSSPSVTDHVSISINNGSYPASLHLPTCVSAQYGDVVQAFRGDSFIISGFKATLSSITEVANKFANTDAWLATLQYVPQSVLSDARLILAIGTGLVAGSVLATAVTKVFRKHTTMQDVVPK